MKERLKRLFVKKEIFTIPNLLSVFRLVLAVAFLGVHVRYSGTGKPWILILILALSGITDCLDGKIARKYDMVSELGKLLDPVADKVTQGVLLICLFSRFFQAKVIFLLFLVKECYMAVMGSKIILLTHRNEGAKWYGKVNTTVFYVVMGLLILFPDMPEKAANQLLVLCACFMLLAFALYGKQYREIRREYKGRKTGGRVKWIKSGEN